LHREVDPVVAALNPRVEPERRVRDLAPRTAVERSAGQLSAAVARRKQQTMEASFIGCECSGRLGSAYGIRTRARVVRLSRGISDFERVTQQFVPEMCPAESFSFPTARSRASLALRL